MSDVAGLELFPAVDVADGRAVGLVLAALRSHVPAGLEGTVLGKALYAEAFTLDNALGVVRT